jgi:hypothetical protein
MAAKGCDAVMGNERSSAFDVANPDCGKRLQGSASMNVNLADCAATMR